MSLVNAIKNFFAKLEGGFFRGEEHVRRLIDVNIFYKEAVRNVKEEPLEVSEGDQTPLRTGLLVFRQWLSEFLNEEAFANADLMIGLMIHFFLRVLKADGVDYTTGNYVKEVNNFTQHFIRKMQTQEPYQQIFILVSRNVIEFICSFHCWLIEERLHFEYTVAPFTSE